MSHFKAKVRLVNNVELKQNKKSGNPMLEKV